MWFVFNLNMILKMKKIKLFFLKIDMIFNFAFLILIYHMDENGKQTNFSQKTQNFNNKKMLFEF